VVVYAEHVGEAEVDELDLMFLDQVEHFVGGHVATSAVNDELVRAKPMPMDETVARQRLRAFPGASDEPRRDMMVQYRLCIAPS
jgi:hypothetical protein